MKRSILFRKLMEASRSVIPILIIVTVLSMFFAPLETDVFLTFLAGALLVIAGLGLFNYGADHSMSLIGKKFGSFLVRQKRLPITLLMCLIIGMAITIAEPDLSVLAGNVPHIHSTVLILTVSAGVGLFLLLGMLRIIRRIPLNLLLIISYGILFLLAFLSDREYISIAFDSGGVTTGPMTTPVIIALGLGAAEMRTDKDAESDGFGLTALCSIGPILAVLFLGFLYPGASEGVSAQNIINYSTTGDLTWGILRMLPEYLKECLISLFPILVLFFILNLISFRMHKVPLTRILIGILHTYAGLVLFLTGANLGFSSLGLLLGERLGDRPVLLLIVAAILGWYIVKAEPAVHILAEQVEDITSGAIPSRVIKNTLSIAVAMASVLSTVQTLCGISILYFLVPGYLIALGLSFFVPKVFTAIAFDAGGVASGPMATTFLLPLAIGIVQSTGGSLTSDAFGTIAMIAMMPLITIQITGLIFFRKEKQVTTRETVSYAPNEIIELMEDPV